MAEPIEEIPAGTYYIGDPKIMLPPEVYQHIIPLPNGMWMYDDFIIGLFRFGNETIFQVGNVYEEIPDGTVAIMNKILPDPEHEEYRFDIESTATHFFDGLTLRFEWNDDMIAVFPIDIDLVSSHEGMYGENFAELGIEF